MKWQSKQVCWAKEEHLTRLIFALFARYRKCANNNYPNFTTTSPFSALLCRLLGHIQWKLVIGKNTIYALSWPASQTISFIARGGLINDNTQIVIWTSSEFQWRLPSSSSIVINDDIRHRHPHLLSSSFVVIVIYSSFFPSFSPWICHLSTC